MLHHGLTILFKLDSSTLLCAAADIGAASVPAEKLGRYT